MDRAIKSFFAHSIQKYTLILACLIAFIFIDIQHTDASVLSKLTEGSNHTPIESTEYLYPERFPVTAHDLHLSTPFTLREQGKAGAFVNSRVCLIYERNPEDLDYIKAMISVLFSALTVAYVLTYVAEWMMTNQTLSWAILLFSLHELLEPDVFRIGVILSVGSDQLLTDTARRVGLTLGGALGLYALYGAFMGFDHSEEMKVMAPRLRKTHCAKKTEQPKGQLFRYARFSNTWRNYGVITPYREGLDTIKPMCLTKTNDKTLELVDCSSSYNGDGEKIINPAQLWTFKTIKAKTENQPPSRLLYNFKDDKACIEGIVSKENSVADKCTKLTVGKGYSEKDCTIYPDSRPSVCTEKRQKKGIPREFQRLYVPNSQAD